MRNEEEKKMMKIKKDVGTDVDDDDDDADVHQDVLMEERMALTSWGIFNGWICLLLRLGRLRRLDGGFVDEALQLLALVVVHSG